MPIIGGHKTISSLLHISSGAQKGEGRSTFSPYTGSLSTDGGIGRGHKGASSPVNGATPDSSAPLSTASINMGTSMTVNVRYVARDMWRKVTFPPGITVTQARDICMLRFNIWQQTLGSATEPMVDTPSTAVGAIFDQHHDHQQQQQQRLSLDTRKDDTPRLQATASHGAITPKSAGATAGFMGTVGGGQRCQPQFREQYGLFWTSAGHWLDADEMLSAYILRKGEVLELQHTVDFVPLLPHEFCHSYAESHIYHLEPDGAGGAGWHLRWAVLRNRVLRVFKEKGTEEPDVEIDLAQRFRLTDQEGRSWPRSSSRAAMASGMSRGNSSSSSLIDIHSIQALLEVPLPTGKTSGECGMFIIQMLSPSSNTGVKADETTAGLMLPQRNSLSIQSYAFRSCNAADYLVWHRTLRRTLSSSASGGPGATGTGNSLNGSGSISGASNNSSDMLHPGRQSETAAQTSAIQSVGNGRNGSGAQQALASVLGSSTSQKPKAPMSLTRHEGYVNRKAPDGYGFRRRYCVLTPSVLFGFLHADDCKDHTTNETLLPVCEFAISLDPSTVTIEAIAWNGRYLLRVFGPEARIIRDKPRATALHPNESSRIHCTDILATAAEAAIEQHGSTFGMLPDSQELVRLMIDDHDEGQVWVVGFNVISGLQITGHSRTLISTRRASSFAEPKPPQTNIRPGLLDEGNRSSGVAAASGAGSGIIKQQSFGEFMVGETSPLVEVDEKQLQKETAMQAPHRHIQQQPHQNQQQQQQQSLQRAAAESSVNSGGGKNGTKASSEPKWIPLSIDKYVKEEEERKRHQGEVSGTSGSSGTNANSAAAAGSSSSRTGDGRNSRVLRPKASNVGESDHGDIYGDQRHHQQYQNGYGGSHSGGSSTGARPPPRFNWFKRRGSTSK
ncbi:hypothetical protein EV177_000394 [Coemansia sp. RSA 1804]|nr:hypothetical protein EV177_000394 [Coemansia sp. RSA 1804]